MARVPPLSEQVPLVTAEGKATAYFMTTWRPLTQLPDLLLSGRLTFEPVNDTTVLVRYRGADNVVRQTTLTFS